MRCISRSRRIVNLRAAEAPIESGRRLVGHHHTVAHRDMADVIGAGEIAVHAIERCRLRRADMRADILDLVVRQARGRGHRHRRRLRSVVDAIGRGHRCGEMLQPVLDPLDRAAAEARGNTHQHDVRKYALLDAEAAAGIGRRAQAEAIARHFQRTRHHAVQTERPHEIGEHVVGVFGRIVFGDDAVGLRSACRNCADSGS